jgi:Zn-finger nucleic acid-binding protein
MHHSFLPTMRGFLIRRYGLDKLLDLIKIKDPRQGQNQGQNDYQNEHQNQCQNEHKNEYQNENQNKDKNCQILM